MKALDDVAKNGGEKNGAADFQHGEKSLVLATGLGEERVVKGRLDGLERGRDWDYVGQAVAYSKNGLRRLMGFLGLSDAVDEGELEALTVLVEAPAKKEAAELTAKVKRFFLNRHLLEAVLPDGTAIRVRVRDREKFKVGMEIPIAAAGEVYVLTRKEPRWPGRW